MGRSLRILAISVIVVLSAGMAVVVYGQLRQSEALTEVFEDPQQLLSGFAFLMLLTVGYLVGKSWSTTRYQRRLIGQLLEEEAIARAQRLNPITQFHHSDVCRDILLRQASYAGRLHSTLSILELTVPNLGKLSLDPAVQPLTEELTRQVKRLCRPIDALLRWTPDSFLLVFPEVTHEELSSISYRIRSQLAKWFEEHFEDGRPDLQWRSTTSDCLGTSGDILLEMQLLLENENLVPAPPPKALRQQWRREKSIGLAMELQVKGVDKYGDPFEESITTERVASDRIWFALKKNLAEQSPLTIAARDGSFEEAATVARLVAREEEQLVEAHFARTPERWIVRCA